MPPVTDTRSAAMLSNAETPAEKKTNIIMDTIYNIFKKDLQRNFEES